MGRIDCKNALDTQDSRCNVCFAPGHVAGMAFSAQASLISLLAVLGLLVVVLIKYRRNRVSPPGGPWRLLRSNLDAYMLGLLLGEIFVAAGGLFDAKWAIEQQVYCGASCSIQGGLTLVGVTSTALYTTAIAVHTWLSIYSNRRTTYSLFVWLSFSIVVWSFVILFALLGWLLHSKDREGPGHDFFTPTPFWCWVSPRYPGEQLGGEYIWLWCCGIGNIIFYVPLFLFSRGNLVFREDNSGKVHWDFNFRARVLPDSSTRDGSASLLEGEDEDAVEQGALRRQAWNMLLYPSAYTLQILGFSVIRWITFSDPALAKMHTPGFAGYATASLFFRFVFKLSGFVNVILMLTTRPNVLLFGSRGLLAPTDPRYELEVAGNVGAGGDGPEPSVPPVRMIQMNGEDFPRNRFPSARSDQHLNITG